MIPKFRIWRKAVNKMANVSALFWKTSEDRSYLCANWWYATDTSFVSSGDEIDNDIILMQSTGLFDKNGVEIFEGDVVSILVEDSEEFAHSQVTFSMGGLGVTLDGDFVPFGVLPLMAQVEYSLEVIGNIYENPELVGVGNEIN